MRAHLRAALFVLSVAAAGSGCPGEPAPVASLSISARPARINELGETSTVKVTATQASGMPGSGSVRVSSAAGSLKSGATLTLGSEGTAETSFSCAVSSDPGCAGRVELTAEWNSVTASTRIQVGDAGVPATGGGGGGGGGGSGGGAGGGSSGGGGPSDGGATDGGATSDGGSADAGPGGPFGDVLLLGQLAPSDSSFALAAPSAPGAPLIGFPPATQAKTAVIGHNGRALYLEQTSGVLYEQVEDDFDGMGTGSRYPFGTQLNDALVPTPACGVGNKLSAFWVRPDTGGVVYRCGSTLTYYQGSSEVTYLAGVSVFAFGYEGRALARTGNGGNVIVAPDGTMAAVFGLIAPTQLDVLIDGRERQVRGTATGFDLVLGMPPSDLAPCQLWHINPNGTAAVVDTYAGPPGGVTMAAPCGGRLDASLRLYGLGVSSGDDVIVRRPRLTGLGSVIYSEAGLAPTSYATFPPTANTFVEPGSSLVTGP